MISMELAQSILLIRPNAEFTIQDNELIWLDKEQTEPTELEIKAAKVAYEAKLKKETTELSIKKKEILERIGLTVDELQTILG